MKMTIRSRVIAAVFLFTCLPTAEGSFVGYGEPPAAYGNIGGTSGGPSAGSIHDSGYKCLGVRVADNNRNEGSDSALVIGIASLTPDGGTEVDDGDNNPDTKRYFLFQTGSGTITVTAAPTSQVGENDLPGSWSLKGGIGASKLFRTVDKSVAGTTVITCSSGTAMKRVTIHVLDIRVSSVGFTGDHLIRKWPGGPGGYRPEQRHPGLGGRPRRSCVLHQEHTGQHVRDVHGES